MEIKLAEKYFWTERRKDFVKLCFVFLPESDEYLSDVKRAEALIGQKIDLHKYRCFYSGKGNEIAEAGREEDIFSIVAGTYFLLPLKNRMQTDDFRKILSEYHCDFRHAYRAFCYDAFLKIREGTEDCVIINHTLSLNADGFSEKPFSNSDVCVYSLDIYKKDADKIEWF